MKIGKQFFLFLAVFVLLIIAGVLYKVGVDQTAPPSSLQTTDTFATSTESTAPLLRIGERTLSLFVADSFEERAQGLSGQTSLPDGTGLLFIFDEDGDHGIWMKEMQFAIDIVWFDENRCVVSVKHNATPESYPEVFYPTRDTRFVLEVTAGVAQEYGFGEGVCVSWEL